jgi:hypothetical protein
VSGSAALAALEGPATELDQALALLRAAGIERPEALPLGSGDRLLLELHRRLAGGDPELTAACPECGEVSAVWLSPGAVPPAAPRCALAGAGGGVREPTYGDLAGLPADPRAAERELLARCEVGAPARPTGTADLEAADDSLCGPLGMECVGCGAAVEVQVDVQRIALAGLVRAAAARDVEVHLLARGYGWPLETIEALPDARRRRLAGLIAEGR